MITTMLKIKKSIRANQIFHRSTAIFNRPTSSPTSSLAASLEFGLSPSASKPSASSSAAPRIPARVSKESVWPDRRGMPMSDPGGGVTGEPGREGCVLPSDECDEDGACARCASGGIRSLCPSSCTCDCVRAWPTGRDVDGFRECPKGPLAMRIGPGCDTSDSPSSSCTLARLSGFATGEPFKLSKVSLRRGIRRGTFSGKRGSNDGADGGRVRFGLSWGNLLGGGGRCGAG
jgi:hypothetical protein